MDRGCGDGGAFGRRGHVRTLRGDRARPRRSRDVERARSSASARSSAPTSSRSARPLRGDRAPAPSTSCGGSGARAEPVRQLARHTAGGGGLLQGATGLLDDRLDLALTTRPAAVVTYAACLRSSRVARAWRRHVGNFVRTGVEPCAVASGRHARLHSSIDARSSRLRRLGSSRTRGSTTKGGEARLVLPLGPSFDGADVVVTLGLEAQGRDAEISIRANEALVDVATVPVTGTTVGSRSRRLAARYVPLEIALLNSARRAGRSSSVRLRLRRLTIERRPTR